MTVVFGFQIRKTAAETESDTMKAVFAVEHSPSLAIACFDCDARPLVVTHSEDGVGMGQIVGTLGGSVGTKRKSNGEHEVFERQAVICKAFANPTRLHLVEMLTRGERWASELQEGLGISKANLSQHLAILKSAGVVSTRREGKQLHCGIAMPEVKQAMGVLRSILKAQGKESRRWS